MEGDYAKQSAKIWEQIVGMLKELGVTLKEVVHVTVNLGSVLLILLTNEGVSPSFLRRPGLSAYF